MRVLLRAVVLMLVVVELFSISSLRCGLWLDAFVCGFVVLGRCRVW